MPDIPFRKGLFHIPGSPEEKPYFIGSRCNACGYTCFPQKRVCVKCRRDDTIGELNMGPYGVLESFAVMQVGPPDFPPPYIVAYVRMKEGPLVFTTMTGCEPKDDALIIGEPVELVIEKIREDSHGNNLLGWKFRPIRKGRDDG